jgi:hypothetical protein
MQSKKIIELISALNKEFNKEYIQEIWESISEESPNHGRYYHKCVELFYLAKKQLNLPKNVEKGDFEELSLHKICTLMNGEQRELEDEIFEFISFGCMNAHLGYVQQKEKVNFQRVREEIGDVAACLVGLLAKLDNMEREEK